MSQIGKWEGVDVEDLVGVPIVVDMATGHLTRFK